MKQKPGFIIVLCALAILASPFGWAGAQEHEKAILALARDSAIVAGGSKYCKFDDDLVEEYIAKAEARLSILAADEYEKVLARLEFKNLLDAYSVREPDLGCSEFLSVFERARRSIQ